MTVRYQLCHVQEAAVDTAFARVKQEPAIARRHGVGWRAMNPYFHAQTIVADTVRALISMAIARATRLGAE